MTGSLTASRTHTYTDARLRAIMPEIGADFYSPAAAGIISFDTAVRWTEDLTFILQQQAAHGFQLQLTMPNGSRIALDYRVSRRSVDPPFVRGRRMRGASQDLLYPPITAICARAVIGSW